MERLADDAPDCVKVVRGRGLLVGLELDPARLDAPTGAEVLLARGIATKDTHHTVLRFAPPLVIEEAVLDWATDVIRDTLEAAARRRAQPPLQP
jgi:ornithine--oxo-acid transaminase